MVEMETDQSILCFVQVLKLHPTLTPVKVALDMGRGSSSELRQVPRDKHRIVIVVNVIITIQMFRVSIQ